MANFHNIKEYLYDNTLTENPNDFTASVASERSLSIKDICALPAYVQSGSNNAVCGWLDIKGTSYSCF